METGLGLNSGIDTADLLQKLVALQRRPINLVEVKREFEQIKLENFNDLQTKLTSFRDVLASLPTQSKFQLTSATFANSNPADTNLALTLETTNDAQASSYALSITEIARETKTVSQGFAATTDTVGTGTLAITIGGTTTNIVIDSNNNTVTGIKEAINNAGLDVRAAILNDGDPTVPLWNLFFEY